MTSSLSTAAISATMSAPPSPQLHASPPFAVVCVPVEFYLCLVCMQARRGEDFNFDAVSKPLEYKLGHVVILVAQPLHDLFAQFLWKISMRTLRCPYEHLTLATQRAFIKRLNSQWAQWADTYAAFQHKATLLRELRHKSVCGCELPTTHCVFAAIHHFIGEEAGEAQVPAPAPVANQVARKTVASLRRGAARFTPMALATHRHNTEERDVAGTMVMLAAAPAYNAAEPAAWSMAYEVTTPMLPIVEVDATRFLGELTDENHIRRLFKLSDFVHLKWSGLSDARGANGQYAHPVLFLVVLAIHTHPERKATKNEVCAAIICHFPVYAVEDRKYLNTSVGAHLRERDIFRHDGDGRFYLDFERDPEWVYRVPGNFWNWTRIGFR